MSSGVSPQYGASARLVLIRNHTPDGTMVITWSSQCRALSKAVTFVNAPSSLGDVGGVQWLRLTSA